MDQSAARPGPRERHLLRRLRRPELFPGSAPDDSGLVRARREDYAQAAEFMERLQSLLAEAAALHPNVQSEQVLSLKAQLDHAYTESAALGGDQEGARLAIRRLVEVIMRAVWKGAADDARARTELEEEARAREHHYRLLDYPLVADLMLPDSPVAGDELVPTLLSEPAAAVEAALWLFDSTQLAHMSQEARELLDALAERGIQAPESHAILHLLETHTTA